MEFVTLGFSTRICRAAQPIPRRIKFYVLRALNSESINQACSLLYLFNFLFHKKDALFFSLSLSLSLSLSQWLFKKITLPPVQSFLSTCFFSTLMLYKTSKRTETNEVCFTFPFVLALPLRIRD